MNLRIAPKILFFFILHNSWNTWVFHYELYNHIEIRLFKLSVTYNLFGADYKRILKGKAISPLGVYDKLIYLDWLLSIKEVLLSNKWKEHSVNHLERPLANFLRFYLSLESSRS